MAMTTSATRSRRAEGLHVSHPQKIPNGHHRLVANAKAAAAQQNNQFAVSPPRAKRQLEASAHECDSVVPKKVRIEVGIPSRPAFQARVATKSTDAKPQPAAAKPTIADILPPLPPNPEPARAAPPSKAAANTTPSEAQPPPNRTKHQEKVVNGLKHELNRLQPSAADTTSQGGRKLRSQEVIRFKSDLAHYFPDYDVVIGNDPKEEHILNNDTPIVITSDAAPCTTRQPVPHMLPTFPMKRYGDELFTDLFDTKKIDLDILVKSYNNKSPDNQDPLPDSLYEPVHKKAERQEKSIRERERGYAQHEKEVVMRLLDGLHGPDWLRVMGVSGITESRKKQYEPAKEIFIKGCKDILNKFKRWTAEERRRKQEKERKAAVAERRAEREATTSTEAEDPEEYSEDDDESEEQEIPDSDADDDASDEGRAKEEITDSDDEPPDDDSDDEKSTAKQLRTETASAASSASKNKGKVTKKRKKPLPAASKVRRRNKVKSPPPPPPPAGSRGSKSAKSETPAPPPAPPPPKQFKSFFEKRHQRDAALNKNRRRNNRNVMAWGKPLPEVEDQDFELPSEFLDPDTIQSRARAKRRNLRARH